MSLVNVTQPTTLLLIVILFSWGLGNNFTWRFFHCSVLLIPEKVPRQYSSLINRRQIIKRINYLEVEVGVEDLQVNFKNFKETYQELWGKCRCWRQNGTRERTTCRRVSGRSEPKRTWSGVQIPTAEVDKGGHTMESQDPHCPWFEEDTRFDSFSSEKVESKIETDKERFLLGIFPYGPNNQLGSEIQWTGNRFRADLTLFIL